MRLGWKQNPSAFRMRMALRICGALLTTVLAGSALALEGAVESVESLKEYAGIWAHSDADCKAKMSGRLDQDGVDRVTSSSYELVGICADGIVLRDRRPLDPAPRVTREKNDTRHRPTLRALLGIWLPAGAPIIAMRSPLRSLPSLSL